MAKKYYAFPDITKGIGIVVMVLYHAMIPAIRNQFGYSFVYSFIETFHLPLFFMISGWLFELNAEKYAANKGKAIKNKFFRLMIPYFSFSIIYYLLINLALRINALQSIINAGGGGYKAYSVLESAVQIFTFNGSMAKSLWFLYALFIISLFNILFPRFMRHPAFFICLIPLGFLASLLPESFILVTRTVQFAFYFSFARFVFGNTDAVFEFFQEKKIRYLFLGIAAAVLCSVYVTFFRNPFKLEIAANLGFLYPLFRPFAAVAMVAFISVGAHLMSNSRAAHFFTYLGKRSMIIYLIHAPLLTQAVAALCFKALKFLPAAATLVIATAVGVAVPLLCNLVIERVPVLNMILTGAPMKRKEKKYSAKH